ncbi:alpha/beta fold hydrolase [Noviherbaspirillum autotrophicum]|uniref:Alpha/beta hydrolase n=1 Tax=Noviherbaspirillum autotrophicum TaxID=709839 RepID=A0A0C1Y6H8_9BURK|nr:alpha/beta hydrolase [Noviherbaspirillum autotrophicum]KIF82558.1 alpha/beta hydrolase [Noviherbaspirillum autotrophicum]
MPIIATNGINLSYDIQGDPAGEPILLIAGLGLQLISWSDAFCRGLTEQGFRVIRFDNRDCGLSTKMDHFGKPHLPTVFFHSLFHLPLLNGYTLYDMAKDATGLLDELGIGKAHIVGASMGGMIAQIVAATSPHRTLTLTSIMSTSGRPGLPGPTLAAHNALFSSPDNPRDINSVIDYFVKMFRVIGSPGHPTPEAELRRRVAQSVRRNVCPGGSARQIMAVAASGDRVALLRTIKAPSLVIHGSDDPLVPIACGRDTARWIPNATMHEIEGMGHDFPPALDAVLSDLIGAHCRCGTEPEARRA